MSSTGKHFTQNHADLTPGERRGYQHPQITDNRTLREALPAAVRGGASDDESEAELD